MYENNYFCYCKKDIELFYNLTQSNTINLNDFNYQLYTTLHF